MENNLGKLLWGKKKKRIKKTKDDGILEDFRPSLELAGVSVTSSLVGEAIEPSLPQGVTNPLTETGRVTGRFVRPLAAVGGFSAISKQLKKIDKNLKK